MSDLFDDVLTLEERFYQQGYKQGLEDGAAAGRIDGRQLGMSTGFDKFFESGRLAGRALVWANRLAPAPPKLPDEDNARTAEATSQSSGSTCSLLLPPLRHNSRLAKNVRSVYAHVEPGTLSTANADTDVQDFDDRLRRAQSKAKVVEKMIG